MVILRASSLKKIESFSTSPAESILFYFIYPPFSHISIPFISLFLQIFIYPLPLQLPPQDKINLREKQEKEKKNGKYEKSYLENYGVKSGELAPPLAHYCQEKVN